MLQSDIAQAIAEEIKVTADAAARRRVWRGAPAISPQAHEAYLKGRYFWNKRTEDALKKGIEHLPGGDRARAALRRRLRRPRGLLHDARLPRRAAGAGDVPESARRRRARALEIDGALGEGYASLAHVRLHDWDWDGLDDDFQRALALNPGHAFAYYWYAEYLMAMGRADESIAMVKTAHRAGSAVVGAERARRHDPVPGAPLRRGDRLPAQGARDRCRAFPPALPPRPRPGAGARRCPPRSTRCSARSRCRAAARKRSRGWPRARGRRLRRDMQAVVDELRDQGVDRYVSPYNMAQGVRGRRRCDRTFEWLERACDERNPDLDRAAG